jgi:hypothetical protein
MSGRFFPGFSGPLFTLVLISLPFASLMMAQQTVSEADTRDRGVVADSFVKQRLAVWQERLSLQDWKISIVMSHPSDLKPKTLGNIHWDATNKSAVIRVLDSSDYRMGLQDMLDDMEFTVVHELIHLELSSLPRSEASRRDEEHAVNQIADALLKLDRKR